MKDKQDSPQKSSKLKKFARWFFISAEKEQLESRLDLGDDFNPKLSHDLDKNIALQQSTEYDPPENNDESDA
jgi:hypothetical protein